MLVANLEEVKPVDTCVIELEADDGQLDYLLFDWLAELLFRFDSEHLLLSEFKVELDDVKLRATCRGEAMDRNRHEMAHEVKAVTYHGLKVEPAADGWLAEVIVDI